MGMSLYRPSRPSRISLMLPCNVLSTRRTKTVLAVVKPTVAMQMIDNKTWKTA